MIGGAVLRRLAVATAIALPGVPAAAQSAWQPPALTITRYDEDWSGLAHASDPARWTERLKYVPLGGDAYLTTGIEARARDESYRDNLWGDGPAPDDGYLWLRLMPYADLHVGQLRAFVQPIAAYAVGVAGGPGPIDQTRVDLLQGFADATVRVGGDATVTLRGGRQMLSLGTERLVGTRYGPNVPLAFDGFRALFETGGTTVNFLAAEPVRPGPGSFDDRSSAAKSLWGVYATRPGFDLYYLGYRNRRAQFDAGSGEERRHSIGLRSFGTAYDWHWNVEAVVQFGRLGDQRIRAWTIGSELGRHLRDVPFKPDLVMRFNMVSGDTKRGDGTLGTFNALFPKGKYFGELSPIGPYNIVNLNPGVTLDLGGNVSAGLMGQFYWRYASADGIYDVPGNLVRSAGTARSRFIGRQIEATADWQATPELDLSVSLSGFAPGAFIRETGPARAIAMLGLEANYRF